MNRRWFLARVMMFPGAIAAMITAGQMAPRLPALERIVRYTIRPSETFTRIVGGHRIGRFSPDHGYALGWFTDRAGRVTAWVFDKMVIRFPTITKSGTDAPREAQDWLVRMATKKHGLRIERVGQ